MLVQRQEIGCSMFLKLISWRKVASPLAKRAKLKFEHRKWMLFTSKYRYRNAFRCVNIYALKNPKIRRSRITLSYIHMMGESPRTTQPPTRFIICFVQGLVFILSPLSFCSKQVGLEIWQMTQTDPKVSMLFSAFWLRSSVVSVLINVTIDISTM